MGHDIKIELELNQDDYPEDASQSEKRSSN